jgi:uncharacterized protein (DUF488 family)
MEVFTIGFAQKTAPQFFGLLRENGIKRLVDIRLSNLSQLAGFTRKPDLPFFLQELCQAEYLHLPVLAPTKELMDAYKKEKGAWEVFEERFKALLAERKVEEKMDRSLFAVPTVLLCSEPTAEKCHRRLVAEYLSSRWGGTTIRHI